MWRQKTWKIAFFEDWRLATKPEDWRKEVLTLKIGLLSEENGEDRFPWYPPPQLGTHITHANLMNTHIRLYTGVRADDKARVCLKNTPL